MKPNQEEDNMTRIMSQYGMQQDTKVDPVLTGDEYVFMSMLQGNDGRVAAVRDQEMKDLNQMQYMQDNPDFTSWGMQKPDLQGAITPKNYPTGQNISGKGACGSGMIGICLKKMFPFIKIDFYDRDKKELKSSYDNYLINSLEKKSAHFYEISSFEKKKYDFIISNPPYLPYNLLNYTSEEFKKSSVFNQNMEHEFFNLINQTKYCLFNISSINRITEKILARKFGRFKIVYNYSVPLRIPALFTENNSFILEEMVKLKLIIPVKNSYHPFYHLINGFLFY